MSLRGNGEAEKAAVGAHTSLDFSHTLVPKPNQDWTMSNTSLNKVLNQFSLQDAFQGNSVICDEFFPVCFWLVSVLKSMAIQNSMVIYCETCLSQRMGSLKSQQSGFNLAHFSWLFSSSRWQEPSVGMSLLFSSMDSKGQS